MKDGSTSIVNSMDWIGLGMGMGGNKQASRGKIKPVS